MPWISARISSCFVLRRTKPISKNHFQPNLEVRAKNKDHIHLGCRRWGCNKWRLKGCLACVPEIGRHRPSLPVFCLFALFRRAGTTSGMQKAFFLKHPLTRSNQKTREGCGCPKLLAGKVFPANFDAAAKFFTDVPAARNAIPAKVWTFSGKENSCWKIGRAFGNAAGFSPP